jgi:hypothetical protein
MAAKVDDPMLKREQFALDTRKSKRHEILTKKRFLLGQSQ